MWGSGRSTVPVGEWEGSGQGGWGCKPWLGLGVRVRVRLGLGLGGLGLGGLGLGLGVRGLGLGCLGGTGGMDSPGCRTWDGDWLVVEERVRAREAKVEVFIWRRNRCEYPLVRRL